MKAKFTFRSSYGLLCALCIALGTLFITACTEQELITPNIVTPSSAVGDAVTITNPGFESSKTGWSGSFAISSDEYTGTKAAKTSGSSNSFEQTVSVTSNTNYTLTAYVLGDGNIGALVGGTSNENGGDYSSYTQVTVTFNSGSNSSVTIYGEYGGDEARFDDFELIEGSSNGSTGERHEEMVGQTVRIENVNSDLWLRITQSGTDDAPVELTTQASTGTWPRWVVEEVNESGTYYYRFKNVASNRRLRPNGSGVTNMEVGATNSTGTWTQWAITSDGNGNYVFKNRAFGTYISASDNTNSTIASSSESESGNLTTWRIEDLNGDDANGQSTSNPPSGTVEDILGTNWKLTVPYDVNGNDSGNVSNPSDRNNGAEDYFDLIDAAEDHPNNFYVDGDEVVFMAHCGGATTTSSIYPRTELRQLDNDGDDSYFDLDDYQYLDVTIRVLELPVERPEVNMVQIHGPSDEPLRVEYNTGSNGLHLSVNDEDDGWENVIGYSLEDRLRVQVTVNNGQLWLVLTNLETGEVYDDINGYNLTDDTGYFKVGCYLQSSITYCEEKNKSESECTDDAPSAQGAVAVSDLTLVSTW